MADRGKEASSGPAQTLSKTISLSMNSPVRFQATGSADNLQQTTPQRAHVIRQRSIMDSKYAASPHHFLLSAGNVLLFAASHGAPNRGTLNSRNHVALVGCSDNLVILVANLSKSKKSHGPSRSDVDPYCGCGVEERKRSLAIHSVALDTLGARALIISPGR